jgi:hypothetical protein
MPENAKNKAEKKNTEKEKSALKAPRKNSFWKKLFKFLLYSFLIVFFIAFLIFVFIQTDMFNNWALGYVAGKFNDSWKEKQSTVYAESIEGNILKGIKLNNFSITVRQDTLVKFSYLEVKYNIFKLFNKKISISSVVLQDPQINLVKLRGMNDSLQWNFDYLFGGGEKEVDTTKSEFKWDVIADNLKINNGNFRILDSNLNDIPLRSITMKKNRWFNAGNLDIKNFNLDMSASYLKRTKIVNMKELSFSTNSEFNLKKLAFLATVNQRDTSSVITNLELVTDRTNLIFHTLYMKHLDPLREVDYEKFGDNDIRVELIVEKFNFKDIGYFLPELDFMNGTISLNLDADGKFGRMNIKNMVLKTPYSVYNFKGRVDNINNPDKLYCDIEGDNLIIDPSDTKYMLPGLQIPDYSHVGKVNVSFRYKGEPLDFKTDFVVKSGYGSVNGTFDMNLKSQDYRYKTIFSTNGLNIGGILQNKDMESNLNVNAEINGTGFDLKTMFAKVNYEVNNSRFMDENIVKSAGTLDINGSRLNGELSLLTDNVQTSVKGNVNLSNLNDAEYTAKGSVKDFDLSKYTKKAEDKSNLNLAFDIKGKGLSLDGLEGTFDLKTERSYFASYHFPPMAVSMNVSSPGSKNGHLNIKSDYFDLDAKGEFNLDEITDVMSYNISVVADEMQRKFNPDTNAVMVSSKNTAKNFSNLDFEYKFTAKNIEPIVGIFDTSGMQLVGDIDGNVKNSNAGFFTAARMNIKKFIYRDTTIVMRDVSGDIDFRNDYRKEFSAEQSPIYPVTANMNLEGDYINLDWLQFKSVKANINMTEAKQNFVFSAKQDTSADLVLIGNTEFSRDSLRVNLDSLYLRYSGFSIGNDSLLVLKYNPAPQKRTISFETFNLKNEMLDVGFSGDLSLAGESNLDIEAKRIRVGRLVNMLTLRDTAQWKNWKASPLYGFIRRLSIKYTGTFDNPVVNLEMNSGLLRYEKSKVGRVDAFIDYKNHLLDADVLVSNAEGRGKLRLTGSALLGPPKENDTTGYFTNRDINIKLKADNFQLNFFSKVIPNFADIRGLLDGEIDASGTVEKPDLTGGMNITKGRFYFGLTGMYHRFESQLKTEGSDIVVQEFRVFNTDDLARHLDAWGRINISGLTINNINLSTSGDIAVLDGSSEGTAFGFYGNMIAGPGDPAITITGNLKKLYIQGQLLIKSANLTFPTIPGTSYDIYSDDFVYKVITDTTGTVYKDTTISVSPDELQGIDPFMRTYVVSEEKSKQVSTNVAYNLNIKTVKNAFVNVNINSVTQQQLLGEIQADLEVNNEVNNELQVFGDLNIVGDSYFRFYRNFKVNDSRVSFAGNPANPYLNIHAVYDAVKGSKSISDDGSNQGVQIVLDITGTAEKPELKLRMFQNGQELTGKDAQSDAISYLLFGVSREGLQPGQRLALAQNIGATTGSSYLSGLLTGAVRNIAPFIINTEINYSEGNVAKGTDIRITSEVGDAIVRFGGKVFSGLDNTEVSIEYPLNKLLHMNLSNNLILEISRTIDEASFEGTRSVQTGVKLVYKIRY